MDSHEWILADRREWGGMAFVIDDIAYICGGENNGSDVTDFWCFNPATGTWKELRELYDKSDDDYDDDYTSIVRSYACAFVIDGKGYHCCWGRLLVVVIVPIIGFTTL